MKQPEHSWYDVALWRYRKEGGAQFPDVVGEFQATTAKQAVILLMACHHLRSMFAASARQSGSSVIHRFDATEIHVTYEYEEV